MNEFTNIISNGSKWAGEDPDTIETLLDVLKEYKLDYRCRPFIERFNVCPCGEVYHFSGNFKNLSHVFSINTNNKELSKTIMSAISENDKNWDSLK